MHANIEDPLAQVALGNGKSARILARHVRTFSEDQVKHYSDTITLEIRACAFSTSQYRKVSVKESVSGIDCGDSLQAMNNVPT